MAEKRKTKRKRKRLPVTFSSHGHEFKGFACNLSSTGIFIRTRKPFKPGVPVEVSLHVDNDCKICVRGRSVRATNVGFVYSKNGMGIQLASESEEYRNFLKELFS
jgi:Tfp pilus assembly protein PilZ